MQYPKDLTSAMEFVWGEGLLSPGGFAEVDQMLEGIDLSGLSVLDVGSGLGGIDIFLSRKYKAGEVVGIDVEPQLVEAAKRRATDEGLSHRVVFLVVQPGKLPFPDESFDLVFSKDAMVHIADKSSLYAEVIRVLRPGGRFVAADWLFSEDAGDNPIVREWVANTGLSFVYTTPEQASEAMGEAGFDQVEVSDHSLELQASNRKEVEMLDGPAGQELAKRVGAVAAEGRIASAKGRQSALDSGKLIPCHLYGRKPNQ